MPVIHYTKPLEPLKLTHIDLLRGIAVLLVIICHVALFSPHINKTFQNALDYGALGVQLFFFLSAYTLCMSMFHRKEENHIQNFYIRRFFRIAPLYYVGILIYFIVFKVDVLNQGGPLKWYANFTLKNVGLSALFINCFSQKGYNQIVPGGWSISTEMMFYLIFPFIFAFYQRVTQKRIYFFLPLVALVIANVYMVLAYLRYHQAVFTDHFYYAFIANQLPVFAVGITYYFLEKADMIKIPKGVAIVSFAVLFALSYELSLHLKHSISLPIFVASLSYCFLFSYFKDVQYNWSFIRRVGQLSYSIYMFHTLFAQPLTSKINSLIADSVNGYVALTLNFAITLVLSFLLAVVSEKYIEKPGIELGKKLIKKLSDKPRITVNVRNLVGSDLVDHYNDNVSLH